MDSKLAVFFNNKKNHHMRQILPPNPENKTWKKRKNHSRSTAYELIINTTQSILRKTKYNHEKNIQIYVVNKALEMSKFYLVWVNDGTRKQ